MLKTPEFVLNTWMQAVNQKDIESLVALYDQNAVLIPTFSNRLLRKPSDIREYFIRLGSREDLSVALHEKTLVVQLVKHDLHALSGIYCWRFAIDGEMFDFEARFSYVLDLSLSSPIIHHHSSQIPRMI
jgi:hypothetical protein